MIDFSLFRENKDVKGLHRRYQVERQDIREKLKVNIDKEMEALDNTSQVCSSF